MGPMLQTPSSVVLILRSPPSESNAESTFTGWWVSIPVVLAWCSTLHARVLLLLPKRLDEADTVVQWRRPGAEFGGTEKIFADQDF